MADKGFLIRGSLSPAMGSTTGKSRRSGSAPPYPPVHPVKRGPGPVQNNRIPSSIAVRKSSQFLGVR